MRGGEDGGGSPCQAALGCAPEGGRHTGCQGGALGPHGPESCGACISFAPIYREVTLPSQGHTALSKARGSHTVGCSCCFCLPLLGTVFVLSPEFRLHDV